MPITVTAKSVCFRTRPNNPEMGRAEGCAYVFILLVPLLVFSGRFLVQRGESLNLKLYLIRIGKIDVLVSEVKWKIQNYNDF